MSLEEILAALIVLSALAYAVFYFSKGKKGPKDLFEKDIPSCGDCPKSLKKLH